LSFVEKHLIPGETIQYQTKLHWVVMLGHVFAVAVLVFFAVVFLLGALSSWQGAKVASLRSVMYAGALICLVAGGILFCLGLLKRSVTEIAVTNKRVIVKTGLAERRSIEILLSRIESVVVDEPPVGRVLGYGTVIVRGTGGTPEVFERIYRPLEFREHVQRQIAGESRLS